MSKYGSTCRYIRAQNEKCHEHGLEPEIRSMRNDDYLPEASLPDIAGSREAVLSDRGEAFPQGALARCSEAQTTACVVIC